MLPFSTHFFMVVYSSYSLYVIDVINAVINISSFLVYYPFITVRKYKLFTLRATKDPRIGRSLPVHSWFIPSSLESIFFLNKKMLLL